MTSAESAPTRVVLRPVATPLPLGMLGLVVASGTLAAVHLGWVPTSQSHTAGLAALLFAVPLQLLGAAFGFVSRDTVAATGLGVQAGLWAVTGMVTLTSAPGSTNAVFGVLLVTIGAALLVAALGAWSKPVAGLVFATTAGHSAVLAVYELTASSGWKTVAGLVGLVLAALALYAALAFELEGAYQRRVLPIGRRRSAVERGEPGVRRQL